MDGGAGDRTLGCTARAVEVVFDDHRAQSAAPARGTHRTGPSHGRGSAGDPFRDQTEAVQVDVFAAVGGQSFFDDLAVRFYRRVADDAVLRPLYPDDLTAAERHLALFLGQYWGGPPAYSQERGHPRLRMRHFPFAIGVAERDAWLANMAAAVRESRLDPSIEARMIDYFERAAQHLVNQP